MLKIMTPGPTQVRENVRAARSLETTNPDLDLAFYEEYKEICEMVGELLKTKNTVYILSGEGILGLEAACASLTEPGDRVLVIDNGVFGRGFQDFVSLYGGIPVLYTKPYDETIDLKELERYLQKDHDFKYATVVHHDTPSGMINDVERIGLLLHQYGILSVVDSVAGMVGENLNVDAGKLDIVCGASQKAISAPVGLTLVAISDAAFLAMEQRKTPIAAFYANLLNFKGYGERKWFPYTMPISDLYGLRAALENVRSDADIVKRHEDIARATRTVLTKAGLKLYGKNGYSNLTTAFYVPERMTADDLLQHMKNVHQIMLAGSFDCFAGKLIRIGHMGENANVQDMQETLQALGRTLSFFDYPVPADLSALFVEELNAER